MFIIYDPDVATLKGRMVHQKPSIVPFFEPIVIPEYILRYHGNVHVAANFFHVQNLIFLVTKSMKINY